MKNILPKISKKIDQRDINWCIEKNYNTLSIDWFVNVEKWMFNSYSVFKDHRKYLILLFLVKKTFDYYSSHFIKLSWDQFFQLKQIELEKFSIIDVAKTLKISKETTRRKIQELERDDIIKKNNSRIIVQTAFFNNKFIQNNKDFLRSICTFASNFSTILNEYKFINAKIKSNSIEKAVVKNFSYAWKIFFEMMIPMMVEFKDIFKSLETWHVWGACAVNQNYELKKYLKTKKLKFKKKKDFLEVYYKIKQKNGINAMSISNITGIPRATVIRKLNNLIRKNFLTIDKKKLYYPNFQITETDFFYKQSTLNIERLSFFLNKIINLAIVSK